MVDIDTVEYRSSLSNAHSACVLMIKMTAAHELALGGYGSMNMGRTFRDKGADQVAIYMDVVMRRVSADGQVGHTGQDLE